ncbi:MFS general substrate transporter [Xylaria cf. heliscus]|nr:MFS general substrate transporter [Xylaria cf. heliscus]
MDANSTSSENVDIETQSATEEVETKPDQEPIIDEEWLAAEKSLTRKLDFTLVPMCWILYVFNYLDRNNIAQARLYKFEEDLRLVGNQFNVVVSILNVSYLLTQVPSNLILTRTRPSLYIPFWVCLWSVASGSVAAAKNYQHLIAIRFVLGIAEAPFFPGVIYLLGSWYPRKYLARRTAALYSGLILATAFAGPIAAGILSGVGDARGIQAWRWLFIIEGAPSFFVGLLAFFLLPDFPGMKTGVAGWLLTEMEQKVAVERMAMDHVSQPKAEAGAIAGLKLAVRDLNTWIFSLMLLANHSAYGFVNFFPTIVKGLHLGNTTTTLLLTAPPYILTAIAALATAYLSDKRGERGFHISVPQLVACIGFVISAATLNGAARYAAAFLYASGCMSSNALVVTWASGSLNQSPEKRAAAISIINVISQIGNIYSPYFFPAKDGPRYLMAFLLMMSFSLLSAFTCLVMKFRLKKVNERILASGNNVRLFTL